MDLLAIYLLRRRKMETRTIDLVHSALCEKLHTHNPEDLMNPEKRDRCHYYLESQVEHGEGMRDHVLWAAGTQNIADTLEIKSDEKMIKFLGILGQVLRNAYILEVEYPNSKEILKRALRL